MAIRRDELMNELMKWTGDFVAIDDDGLTLIELYDEGDASPVNHIEVGGIPEE